MKLEYKDACKEVYLETCNKEDATDAIDVLQVLTGNTDKVLFKPTDVSPIQGAVMTEEKKQAVETKNLPPLCYVVCDKYATCPNAGDTCNRIINRIKTQSKCSFLCGYTMDLEDFNLDYAQYKCTCCGQDYKISCCVDGENITVKCGNCDAPVDLKWNTRRQRFDNLD